MRRSGHEEKDRNPAIVSFQKLLLCYHFHTYRCKKTRRKKERKKREEKSILGVTTTIFARKGLESEIPRYISAAKRETRAQ